MNYFITGTDTEVGKTIVSCALLTAFRHCNLSTLAMKPVAAGCEFTVNGWRNDDALALMQYMTESSTYQAVNPFPLPKATAPHIASQLVSWPVSLTDLVPLCEAVLQKPVDVRIFEGAGGWRLLLNSKEAMADLVKHLNLEVILVVGLKLGCLNHACLTAEAIRNDGLKLAAWVANHIDPEFNQVEAYITSLQQQLAAPCLGLIPHRNSLSPFDNYSIEQISKQLIIKNLNK